MSPTSRSSSDRPSSSPASRSSRSPPRWEGRSRARSSTRGKRLYNHHEPTSYHQIIKLLSRHAHERGSQRRDAAVAELKALREWEKDALRPTIALKWQHARPDGSIAYEEDLTPEVLIDLFLHGKYLHKANEKSDKLAAWPLAHVAQQVFFGAITALSQVYWVGRNVVAEVLKVAALLNAAPAG